SAPFAVLNAELILALPPVGTFTQLSRGIETARGDPPSRGKRKMINVSVLTPVEASVRSLRSIAGESGRPCAPVRLSEPTSRMSSAPASVGGALGTASRDGLLVTPSRKSSTFRYV